MATDQPKIDDIYLTALEREGEQRSEYLDEVCGNNADLRRRVERLLSAKSHVGSFLEAPAPGIEAPATIDQPVSERPGDTIGPYKLLQQIGEGGMGVVYMAEQTEPVERRVALKIIKPGMDTRQVIARFEAERQALAMMDHPNISKVFDAGVTDIGRPYFVMELVKGIPITEYCDEHHLMPRERLELFVLVCQAIQHAHQKGIIHRDIKPSNVLVTDYDDHPVPKVIDFGVAKAIDHRLTEKTMFTEFGQVLGTFEYMSPEQAKLNQWDVDTRTDVYSLGVLLYELLSGEVPFDRQRLRSAAIDELLRIIREEDPPRPSTRLSTSESLPTIAANRKTEPKKLSTLIHGELDWIVMKALEKDRTRRYDTASKFAEDVEHYLNNETVEACPPSAGYLFRKFAKRNKAAIATTAAIAAALVVGMFGTTWQAIRATDAEQLARQEAVRANEEAQRADAEAKRATDEAGRAEQERDRADSVKRFLLVTLYNVSPDQALGKDTEFMEQILEETARLLNDKKATVDSLVAAELHGVLGHVYYKLGILDKAAMHLEQAGELYLQEMGPNDDLSIWPLNDLAMVHWRQNRLALAAAEFKKVIDAYTHLGGEAGTLGRLRAQTNLATMYMNQGKFDEAEKWFVKTLDEKIKVLTERHIDTLRCMNNLGVLYKEMGRLPDAEKHLKRCLELRIDTLPKYHPEILATRTNLANIVGMRGDYAEALKLERQILDERKRISGPTHPDTLGARINLASTLLHFGELNDAEENLNYVMNTIPENGPGQQNELYLVAMDILADVYAKQGKLDQAIETQRQMIEKSKQVYVAPHARIASPMAGLADIYAQQGNSAEAIAKGEEALDMMVAAVGRVHLSTAHAVASLGYAYVRDEQYARAVEHFEEWLPTLRQVAEENQHGPLRDSLGDMARASYQLEQTARAHKLLNELLELEVSELQRSDRPYPLYEAVGRLLNFPQYPDNDYVEQVLKLARRACTLAERDGDTRLWKYLDTLARAQHETGDTAAAIETQRQAVELMPDALPPKMRGEHEERLRKYESIKESGATEGTNNDEPPDETVPGADPTTIE